MKLVLIAGTINHHPDTEERRYVHLDASPRGLYDAQLDMFFAPDVVSNLADNLPMFPDNKFDEVICDHVFEHIPAQHMPIVLTALRRVLKIDGQLIVETPNMTAVAKAWLEGGNQEELQQWIHGEDVGGDFDGHRYSYSPEALRALLEMSRFRVDQEIEKGLAIRFYASPRR